MKFSLNIPNRVLLLSNLPSESNILTLKVIKKLKEDIGFSDEELVQNEIKMVDTENGKKHLTWKIDSKNKEVEIGLKGIEIIVNVLKDLDKQNKLTEQHIELYDMFVGE